MSERQETMRPKPSDYGIDGGNPEINQALADLIEMGLVVDSGQRRFQKASGGSCGSQSHPKREENSAPCAGKTEPNNAGRDTWITVWWPECDLRAVPRVVPEDWTFEIYSPGEGPAFRRTTHHYGDV